VPVKKTFSYPGKKPAQLSAFESSSPTKKASRPKRQLRKKENRRRRKIDSEGRVEIRRAKGTDCLLEKSPLDQQGEVGLKEGKIFDCGKDDRGGGVESPVEKEGRISWSKDRRR